MFDVFYVLWFKNCSKVAQMRYLVNRKCVNLQLLAHSYQSIIHFCNFSHKVLQSLQGPASKISMQLFSILNGGNIFFCGLITCMKKEP